MSNTVPPVPYKSALLNSQGFLSEPWVKWFRQMFNNIVGPVTPATSADVSASNSTISSLAVQINDLSQGRDL